MTLSRFILNRSGVAAIEFVMLAPVAIGLIFAIVDAGLLIFTQVGLEHAVESAARCAATNLSTCGNLASIQNYAASQTYGIAVPATAFASPPQSPNLNPNPCGILVTASYSYTYFSSYYVAASIPLAAKACFPT